MAQKRRMTWTFAQVIAGGAEGTRTPDPTLPERVSATRRDLGTHLPAVLPRLGPLATVLPRVCLRRRARRGHDSDLPPLHAP